MARHKCARTACFLSRASLSQAKITGSTNQKVSNVVDHVTSEVLKLAMTQRGWMPRKCAVGLYNAV